MWKGPNMSNFPKLLPISLLVFAILNWTACTTQPANSNSAVSEASPSPSVSPSATIAKNDIPSQLTLPILDALLAEESFVNQLKTNLQLSDDQINSLKTIAKSEVSRLRASNAEQKEGDAAGDARSRAIDQLTPILGGDKTTQLAQVVSEFWAKGADETEGGAGSAGKQLALSMSKIPNAVPTDTRVVVNIPSYRMDVFENGSLVKSYRIGIGYPEFPLPQGLRKAQTIIFNPTWTPPDSPWVANMKDVTVGEKVEAGSKLNPLGPIKIPIGMPSLIHGGKSPTKLGGFASHGCVGLTNPQVKDFARVLAQVSGAPISDQTIQSYLTDNTVTKVVKLGHTVPVELRYETIVVQDGNLHIYKDVYDQNTNTEEQLRAVLDAEGLRLEDLSSDERTRIMKALNAMSAHPNNVTTLATNANISNDNTLTNANSNQANSKMKKKAPPEKKIAKNQKEIVVELAGLHGKGYPAPVNLDTGLAKSTSTPRAAR